MAAVAFLAQFDLDTATKYASVLSVLVGIPGLGALALAAFEFRKRSHSEEGSSGSASVPPDLLSTEPDVARPVEAQERPDAFGPNEAVQDPADASSWEEAQSFFSLVELQPLTVETMSQLWKRNEDQAMKMIVGSSPAGDTVHVDLALESSACAVIGLPGEGTHHLLRTMVSSLALYPPERIRLHFVDLKGGGVWESLRDLPHTMSLTVPSEVREDSLLQPFVSLVDDKRRVILDAGSHEIGQHNASHRDERLPWDLLVLDELDASSYPWLPLQLSEICRTGRASGVALILGTQSEQRLAALASRIRMRLLLSTAARTAYGASDRSVIPARPFFGLVEAGGITSGPFQAPYLPESYRRAWADSAFADQPSIAQFVAVAQECAGRQYAMDSGSDSDIAVLQGANGQTCGD